MKILSGILLLIGVIFFIFQPIPVFIIYLIYQIYSIFYFNSENFKKIKDSISKHTENCNELNRHIEELKKSYINIKSYDYGESNMEDMSNYNFSRKEWKKSLKNNRIHNCSASVCKNANDKPFEYLCKYFDIKVDEETLSNFENVLNDFAAAEQGRILLLQERDSILDNIKENIPKLIYLFSKKRLIKKLGFETIDLSDLYFPVYTFQYISAGGNSSMKSDIKLDIENLNRFIVYLGNLVKFRKSVEGQRALMTSILREKIKSRDNYVCKNCGLSANKEKNLLLEIDHIIPLSKGGITSEENLQTLCWKCNRSKGSKIEIVKNSLAE